MEGIEETNNRCLASHLMIYVFLLCIEDIKDDMFSFRLHAECMIIQCQKLPVFEMVTCVL